jgi:hypothetical protein
VKLWIDECLSPTLVERANRRGYWATCNRDRDLLADFVALYRRLDLHTGLVILPQAENRKALLPLLDAAFDYIERQAKAVGETPAEWMLNKRVEIDLSRTAVHDDLPSAE